MPRWARRSWCPIGWNGRIEHMELPLFRYLKGGSEVYFVHPFYVSLTKKTKEFALTTTTYGGVNYVSSIQRGNVVATQFHLEKSGKAGLEILHRFLDSVQDSTLSATSLLPTPAPDVTTSLVKRIVLALDVRSNDHGDLVGPVQCAQKKHRRHPIRPGRGLEPR